MRLAEALIQRSDTQKRIKEIDGRLAQNATVQEGEEPAENPQDLFDELERLLGDFQTLIAQINRTNLAVTLPDGTTITDALARRDILQTHITVLKKTVDAASPGGLYGSARYSRSEIRSVVTFSIRDQRTRIDALSRELRELDTAIQATNWAEDLLE